MELTHTMQEKGKVDGIVPYQLDRFGSSQGSKYRSTRTSPAVPLIERGTPPSAEGHGERLTHMADP